MGQVVSQFIADYGEVLVEGVRQDDRSIVMEAGIFAFRVRRKRIKPWGTADPAAALRSWHENPSLFPVYADYNTAKRKKQEKDFRKMRRRFLAAAVFLFHDATVGFRQPVRRLQGVRHACGHGRFG